MADQDEPHVYAVQGQDGETVTHVVERRIEHESGLSSRVSVTQLVDPTGSQGLLQVRVSPDGDQDDLFFELSGEISPRHQQALIRFLTLWGVHPQACSDAVDLLFSLYFTHEDDFEQRMRAHVHVETYYDMTPEDEDYTWLLGLGPTPASRDVVEALEKVTVGPGAVIREASCAVCLDEFSVGSELLKLPCSHAFHGECIARWLRNRPVCPCRIEGAVIFKRHHLPVYVDEFPTDFHHFFTELALCLRNSVPVTSVHPFNSLFQFL